MKLTHAVDRIRFGVKRQRRLMLGIAVFISEKGVFFLNMTAVWKQDATQSAGAGRRMNASFEALAYQQGDIAAVVQVGMRENDSVNLRGWRRQEVPVSSQLFVNV